MRKASKILFLVGAIVAIVAAVTLLVTGLILIIIPNTDAFVDVVGKQATPEELQAAQAALIICGSFCLAGIPFCALDSFFGFKAFKSEKPSVTLNVLNIVFGVLSVYVNIVAGIFALVADGQEQRRAQAAEQKK